MLHIYCDGGLVNENGGFTPTENAVGGWAFILVNVDANKLEEVIYRNSGSEIGTSNNKMEMIALIEAFEYMKKNKITDKQIEVYSDSMYVISGITSWIHRWIRSDWKNMKGEPIKNKELWLHIYELDNTFKPRYIWVKGHDGNHFNEECDIDVQTVIRKKKIELDEQKK